MADKVTDPIKIVTDPVLLSALEKQGIDKDYVEFTQDYALHSLGKEHSPYAKFYQDLQSNKRFMVVSQLPMVNTDSVKVEVGWQIKDMTYISKVNQFQAQVSGKTTTVTCINDQPTGEKTGNKLTYSPRLFLNGVEKLPLTNQGALLATDPVNPNYSSNVLIWNYGICVRMLRLIEGKILGTWVFAKNPLGEVRIVYDQVGDFKLHLGQYAINDSEELIPIKVFDNPPFGGYPLTISDSLTFYPDAHPESTSVDGCCAGTNGNLTWSALVAHAGGYVTDAITEMLFYVQSSATSNYWLSMFRMLILFDTAGLPDNADISGATLSLYGTQKHDPRNNQPNLNIYSSNPASSTGLVAGDYAQLGSTAFSSAIAYNDWKVATPFWNDFVLNAAGIAAISKTGVTKLGARNANYDVSGTPPTWGADGVMDLYCYSAEQGNGYKPKLVVTYTVDQPFRQYYPSILAH